MQDFGDPESGTRYALCVYDESEPDWNRAVEAVIAPVDASCTIHSCWKRLSSGFIYRSPDRSMKLNLKSGDDGRASIVARGKVEIESTAPERLGRLLNQEPTVRIQLINDVGAGICWEAVYPAPARKNSSTKFVDSGDE